MERDDINPMGKDETFTADSREDVLEILLNRPGYRSGQGDWEWTVVAQQADPTTIRWITRPRSGNDWILEVINNTNPVLTELQFDYLQMKE